MKKHGILEDYLDELDDCRDDLTDCRDDISEQLDDSKTLTKICNKLDGKSSKENHNRLQAIQKVLAEITYTLTKTSDQLDDLEDSLDELEDEIEDSEDSTGSYISLGNNNIFSGINIGSSRITVNGKTIKLPSASNNIRIINNRIYCDNYMYDENSKKWIQIGERIIND